MKLLRTNRAKKAVTVVAASAVVAFSASAVLVAPADAHEAQFRAKLRDPSGAVVGSVTFRVADEAMYVEAVMRPNRYVAPGAFHGFHIHANNDPANGSGCVADPNRAASTWFVSADGHLSETGQTHGNHNGDLPSPLILADGTAELSFTTDRISPADLKGTAVVLHAKPDNFGNVPVGTAADQYTANSDAATSLTARTGNASDRVACGLLQRSRFRW